MKILALDCATETCSVALWLDGALSERGTLARGATHGEVLLPMLTALLQEAGVELRSLDGIAVGRGPGAFTGVRLAISIAQGLAYSSGIAVLGISTLAAIAQQAAGRAPGAAAVLVCQDARMGEIYTARFELGAMGPRRLGAERLCPPDALTTLHDPPLRDWLAAGTGFAAFPQLASAFPIAPLRILADTLPMAGSVAQLAALAPASDWVPPGDLQPVYLRDSVAKPAAVNKS